MDNTREFAGVVVPWRLWLASEATDTTECRILCNGNSKDHDFQWMFTKPHLDGYCRKM